MQDIVVRMDVLGGSVELQLHEDNTYTIVRKIGYAQTVLLRNVYSKNLWLTMNMILDNEAGTYPTAKYIVIQE